jgi:hypothetical protein
MYHQINLGIKHKHANLKVVGGNKHHQEVAQQILLIEYKLVLRMKQPKL